MSVSWHDMLLSTSRGMSIVAVADGTMSNTTMRSLLMVSRTTLFCAVRSPRSRSHPMDCACVQGHVQRARQQTQDRILIALEVNQSKHVCRRKDKGDDRTDKSPSGDLTEFSFRGSLEDRSCGHQWTDEEDCQPGGNEDVVENEGDGCEGFETDKALVVDVEDGDAIEDHEDQDDGVRG